MNNKKFLSLVLSLVMVLGTFTSVFAASTTDKKDEKTTETKVEKVEKIVGKDNKIQYIIDKKFVEGYENGDYGYDKNIKRSEITKLLVFANGHKELSEKLQGSMKVYSDVDTTFWANGVITVGTTVPSSANNQAMLNGYPTGKFLPERNVTYAELAKMLVVLAKDDLTADMVKTANANWASQWMTWAAQLGILDDVTVANSDAFATRADAFTMLYNALYKMQAFKRVPANEKLGILSDLSNKKLVLNQDKEEEYVITDDTVFVRNNVNGKADNNDNVVKVTAIKNPEYYLGSLVRVMYNDKKEITHILELGNPEKGALSNKKDDSKKHIDGVVLVEDNTRWDDIADATISTEMANNLTSIKELDDEDVKKKVDSWARIEFDKKDDTKVKRIKIEGKQKENHLEVEVNDDTKVFVANPANNQMKELKDVYEALRLIGYRDTNKAIPNVYVGYNEDSRTTSNHKFNDNEAKVIVFNVVAKNNDLSEKYRVINETSSKGKSILEDVDAKKYEEDDFANNKYFPYNYGELYDVIELTWDNVDKAWDIKTLIEADDTKKFPIVEVTEIDGNYITVKDEDKNTAVLNIKDADIFTKKLSEGDFIQYEIDDAKDKTLATISIRDDKNKAKGFLQDSILDFEEGTVYGNLENVEGRRITVKIDRDLTDAEIGKKTEVFVVADELKNTLKEFVGSDLRFHAKEYDDEYQASNIEVKIGNEWIKLSTIDINAEEIKEFKEFNEAIKKDEFFDNDPKIVERNLDKNNENDKGGVQVQFAFTKNVAKVLKKYPNLLQKLEVSLYNEDEILVTNEFRFNDEKGLENIKNNKLTCPFNYGSEGIDKWSWNRGAYKLDKDGQPVKPTKAKIVAKANNKEVKTVEVKTVEVKTVEVNEN